jgi:hypothetical protein
MFMKKFKLSGVFILFCVFSSQFVFGDIILKKDEPSIQPNNVTSMSSMTKSKSTSSTSSSSYIPVSANIVGSELFVDFSSIVGTAYVSVVDNNGNVVYQTVVDTFSSSEVVIPVDGMSSGNYSLKISYGSTKLTGSFQL